VGLGSTPVTTTTVPCGGLSNKSDVVSLVTITLGVMSSILVIPSCIRFDV
jgi:hypothetical protein